MSVKEGKLVSVEYTLKDEKGQQIESNVGQDPLTYLHGTGQIIPGLEKSLDGMKAGDTKEVTVEPEQAYGQVDARAVVEVPSDKVPEEARKIGSSLQSTGENGQPMFARVSEIKDSTIILDFNHPLAGKTLTFDVKILEVNEASAQQ
jgi:FKBP-type peptidyl-prolyl cis-trans isomerase SlyD